MNAPSRLDARTLRLSRSLACTPMQAFEVWTSRFTEWWGPHGMTTPFCEMDLRPGGVFRTVMRASDGSEYPTTGLFLEVTPGKRIVFTDAYGPAWEPNPSLFFTAVTTFEAEPGGRTLYQAKAVHWTDEATREHESMGFHEGWGESADRLAALVQRLHGLTK